MAKFKPGQSGNPAGRPKGTKLRATRLREDLAKDVPGILERVKDAALDGDMTAARILLDRVMPPVRSESATVEIPALAAAETLSEKARALVDAVAEGQLAPSTASDLLSALGATAKIIELDELERRIAALENGNDDD